MKKTFTILLLVTILLIPIVAFGADALYRLMHNDQDALVISEITKVNDNSVEFKVKKSIISVKDLNQSSNIKQLDINEFKLENVDLIYPNLYDNIEDKNEFFKEGDFYLVSLNKKTDRYEVAWGIYKLSSLDYETLDILYPENSPQWKIMEAMAIKEFINSNGHENNFSFDGGNNILRSGDRILYDGNPSKIQDVDVADIEVEENMEVIEEKGLSKYDYILFAITILIFIILVVRGGGKGRP